MAMFLSGGAENGGGVFSAPTVSGRLLGTTVASSPDVNLDWFWFIFIYLYCWKYFFLCQQQHKYKRLAALPSHAQECEQRPADHNMEDGQQQPKKDVSSLVYCRPLGTKEASDNLRMTTWRMGSCNRCNL